MGGFLRGRRKGYAAAFRVERNRADAQQLRVQNPEMYQWILEQAGEEAKNLAESDPDAWVALFLASTKDEMKNQPAASEGSDPTFSQYLELFGGQGGARELIIDHMARHHQLHVNDAEADALLEGFRRVGIANDLSLGEYLDEVALGDHT